MKKLNNFQIAKVSVLWFAFACYFANFSLELLIKMLLKKKLVDEVIESLDEASSTLFKWFNIKSYATQCNANLMQEILIYML